MGPSAWHTPNCQTPRKEAGVRHNPHSLHSLCTKGHSAFRGRQSPPDTELPDASQGPAWLAGLSKGPVLGLPCEPSAQSPLILKGLL